MILALGRRRPQYQEVTMSRSIRTASLAAALASTLALAPAAFADSQYGDTTGVGLIHASTVKAPVATAKTSDTTGVGLIHASMVEAAAAKRPSVVRTDSGFQWEDAGIGAAAGFGAALASVGLAAGLRGRRRIVA
jgi:hypothetical protein